MSVIRLLTTVSSSFLDRLREGTRASCGGIARGSQVFASYSSARSTRDQSASFQLVLARYVGTERTLLKPIRTRRTRSFSVGCCSGCPFQHIQVFSGPPYTPAIARRWDSPGRRWSPSFGAYRQTNRPPIQVLSNFAPGNARYKLKRLVPFRSVLVCRIIPTTGYIRHAK